MAVQNTFYAGVGGASYEPNTYEDYANMIGKLAKSMIRNVEAKNPLAVFDKGRIDNGDTIEQVVIGLLESQGYDSTGANALTPKQMTNLVARYWNDWQKKVYKATLRPEEIRKITPQNAVDEASDLARKILASLDQSAEYEHFVAFKELLTWGSTQAILVNRTPVAAVGGTTNYKGILKKLKDTIEGMKFVNDTFNTASFKRATNPEDIIIVMPYDIKNAIDVDELAGVFNLDKAEIKNRIILSDNTSEKKIYVLDKNCILSFTRLYEIREQLNAEGNFWNYFLHTERLMSISPLFDGVVIPYE